MEDGLIPVLVAVNMAGARLGQKRLVNPENPYIAERLRLGYLVRISPDPEHVETMIAEESRGPSEAVAGDG